MGRRIVLCVAVLLIASSAFAVKTKDMAAGLTAAEIAQILTGGGVVITNAKVTGAPAAIGSFTEGIADGLSIDQGVILSSGKIETAAGPNKSEGTSGSMGSAGDASLDALIKPYKSKDAVILEFDAVTTSSNFSIRYIFASEEYKEYVGSQYNDVFAFFVDGQNIALVPGTAEPVAINTINHKKNSSMFNDNPAGTAKFGTSFDGFTTELIASTMVSPGTTHHIRLAVADASDSILDSAVYIAKGGISGGTVAAAIVPEYHSFLVAHGQTNSMKVTVYGVPEKVTPVMSASGLPGDASVSFGNSTALGTNTFQYNMTTAPGPKTPSGAFPMVIQADLGETDVYSTVLVTIDCTPPLILSTPGNHPESQTVTRGTRATLKVVPTQTGNVSYQWFYGHTGSTRFPVQGATAGTFTTPPVTTTTDFWARVYSPCGSVDSNTATITPK